MIHWYMVYGAIEIGDWVGFSMCMAQHNTTKELVNFARMVTTMCNNPNAQAFVMKSDMNVVSTFNVSEMKNIQ